MASKIGEVPHHVALQELLNVANLVASEAEDYCGLESSVELTAADPDGLRLVLRVAHCYTLFTVPYLGLPSNAIDTLKYNLAAISGPKAILSILGYERFKIWSWVSYIDKVLTVTVAGGDPELSRRITIPSGTTLESAKILIGNAVRELEQLIGGV